MPAKIAKSAPRPAFGLSKVAAAVHMLRLPCRKVKKREYSWQIGSHPWNPS
jgi:hypothetical protein